MNTFSSVYQAFEESVSLYGPRPFLRVPAISSAAYADDAVEYSYDGARDEVTTLINAYNAIGLKAGERVALAFDSRVEIYLHLLALNSLRVSVVPLSSGASDEELLYNVKHSDSRLIVSLPEHRDRLAALNACDVLTDAELQAGRGSGRAASAELSEEAALLYTSGTTGKPKGCMLSNEYFLALGTWYKELGGICTLDQNDRLLTALPPNHMNALCTSFPAMMLCGGCVIQVDRFHPRSWWQTVREERATVVHCLGVMTAILLTLPEDENEDYSSQIKFCFGPGSDPRHQGVFEQRFGVPLIEAWAMTESGAGGMTIACEEPRHVGQRCIGKAVATMDYRVVDEQDKDVASGEPGELLVRTKGDRPRKNFFSGYYKDDAATEESWRGGWWHTGDVVREGDDASLFFVDRRKNVIRRSGENIAAVEVEAVLLQYPGVTGCAVCAVPDEIRGDEVFAFVINENSVDARQIFDHCMKHLTYFKVPAYIALVPSLPLTASQKVSRGEIRNMAREKLADGDCVDLRDLKRRKKTDIQPAVVKNRKRTGYEGVVVTTPVSVEYERYSPQPAHWWLARALSELGRDSGLRAKDIDGLCVSSFSLFPDTAAGLTQHFGLTPRWLDHVPTGGASGVITLRRAARAVQSGDANVVACLSGDANYVDSFRSMLTTFSRFSQDASYPYGSGGPNGSFSLITSHHMKAFGTRREDFGKLCVAQRDNALQYPQAIMKKPLTLDDYMNARLIADPIALFDCVMPCAGAEAYLVMREEEAKAQGLAYVNILSTIERHNSFPDDPIQVRGGWALDVDEFWRMAGIGPDDIDLLQTYDDYPVISVMQMEDLGFCEKGAASDFIDANSFTFNGSFPHNTSGGQLSVGQAGAAGGFLGLVEAIRQLTGSAGANAVPDARYAAISGFGIINFDRGLCSGAAILEGN